MDIVHAAMLVVEHGGKRGAILVGIPVSWFLLLLIAQVTVNWAFDDAEYYSKHAWPKSLATAVPGLACGVTGLALLPGHHRARVTRKRLMLEDQGDSGRLDVLLKLYFDLILLLSAAVLFGFAGIMLVGWFPL